ncbi:uncharacterized protein LOC142322845 isoform X2 [Lycorma delicatula]|uniref:uncharacterized protein LOC142322845 isoform X2 n=1 Tax=Lycorma delicatula TaxID=130591 RepID=UPI003F519743
MTEIVCSICYLADRTYSTMIRKGNCFNCVVFAMLLTCVAVAYCKEEKGSYKITDNNNIQQTVATSSPTGWWSRLWHPSKRNCARRNEPCFNYKECCFGLICEPTKRNTSIAYCKFPVGPIIQEVGNFLVFREMLKGGLLLFNALFG